MKDKRQHQRIKFLRKVLISSDQESEHVILDVLDYSMGGMSIFSKTPYTVGCSLYLDSLMTLDGDQKPLGLNAEVKHVQEHDANGYVIGLEFTK